jgi:hypothetical protein
VKTCQHILQTLGLAFVHAVRDGVPGDAELRTNLDLLPGNCATDPRLIRMPACPFGEKSARAPKISWSRSWDAS